LGGASVLAVAAIVALVVVVGGGGGGDDPPVRGKAREGTFARALVGPESAPFALYYQRTWEQIERDELDGGEVAAGIRRRDHRGAVTVSVGGPLEPGGMRRLSSKLRSELKKRFDDLQFVSSKTVRTSSGTALYTSWVRRGSGSVQANLVVPDGRRTYLLDATVQGTAREAAVEVGTIFQGFRADRASGR
jgi:hypothetical protein